MADRDPMVRAADPTASTADGAVRTPIRTVGLVTNPTSNKGRGAVTARRVRDLLNERADRFGLQLVDLTGDSREGSLARIAAATRGARPAVDAVVMAGGDGMVSLGVNAVGGRGVPMGIVACGSGNDFARGLGLPVDHVDTAVEGIVAAIVTGTTIDLDLGHVRSAEDGGARLDAHYAGMLSCGLDAAINDGANRSRLPSGMLRYMASGVNEILHLKDYGYRIRWTAPDGTRSGDFELSTPLVTVANARYIGSGIELSPDSKVDDGTLEFVWTRWRPSAAEGLDLMRRAYHGRHKTAPVMGYRQVASIEIAASGKGAVPPAVMADGETLGELPVRVDVAPGALRLLVPPRVRDWMEARER